MPITYHKGNLFYSGADMLTNTINCVGVMGGGIALQFRERYPAMFKAYQLECKNNLIRPGEMWIWTEPVSDLQIVNFPTKRHWKEPSYLKDIKSGLVALKIILEQEPADKSIAIPRLGSGLGGLNWDTQVHPLVVKYLGKVPMKVMVY